MSRTAFFLSVAVIAVISLGVAGFSYFRPLAHWDVIGYVASALKALGLSGEELRRETYGIIEKAYDPAIFAVLTASPDATGHGAYRYTVYSDPVSLEQQLPFYRIRVFYIFLLNALAPVSGGLVGAAQVISATCAGLITLATGVLLLRGPRALPPLAAVLALPLIVAGAGVVTAGRVETPDALAALIAFLALALMHRNRLAALCLIGLLPFVRTDGVLLAGLTLVLLLAERETRLHYYALLLCAFVSYVAINHFYGNYGHLVLFNFTLLNGAPNPYPATMEIATEVGRYAKFYFYAVIKFAPVLLFLGLVSLIALIDIRRAGKILPMTATALMATAFVLGHFLLFPLGSERHYIFAIAFVSVYAVQTLYRWAETAGQAEVA